MERPKIENKAETKPTLNIDELIAESGLTPEDFNERWKLNASAYRSIICELANNFTEDTELTHSEYITEGDPEAVSALVLCMSLGEKSFEEFKKFLIKNENLIPKKLRNEFIMYIGYNYAEDGGIAIYKDSIESIEQYYYDNLESTDKISYTRAHDKDEKFGNLLAVKIKQLLKK